MFIKYIEYIYKNLINFNKILTIIIVYVLQNNYIIISSDKI